jgi:hypothetical protein
MACMLAMAITDPVVPVLVTLVLAGQLTELVVVGLVLAERLMGHFDVGHQLAIHEEGAPEPCAERDDHLEPLALHDGGTLHVGIVGHFGRLPEGRRERVAKSNSAQASKSFLSTDLNPVPSCTRSEVR